MRERGNNISINSRTYSVDELHRNHPQFNRLRRRDGKLIILLSLSNILVILVSQSPLKNLPSQSRRKLSADPPSHTRFDRLSTNLIDYSNTKKNKSSHAQVFSTLSHHSNGADSGYSEESFLTSRTCQRPIHTSCPHCHCEQRSSFNSYQKLPKTTISSSDSSPSDLPKSYENLSHSQLKSSQTRPSRTLQDKRRRNLSCDGSLWSRSQQHKAIAVYSEPPHQRHLTTIATTQAQSMMNSYTKTLPSHSNVFGELNLTAIELDSLRTSFSSSSYSSSSSIQQEKRSHSRKQQRQQLFLVWHEYENHSSFSQTNGSKPFSVRRGDQVRLLKRMGKSTLLVQKDDDGSIGFLPQTCLTHHPINSFLSLKGLRETVL